ncbi:hypothetical protein C0030_000120 [Candidatus Liberibacter solanacearum]|uniref:EamA domain-containing protein n=1 Tax=Candidatus Liberibacter solanacearum TaxID=556287 RepID=A0A424FNU8_9HYPH|nr:EamA family transporter [Candidatus Liberibacter solanacearum]RPD37824.1 hypothetical protein C0030_000120 [Candidatus Liberibacter solanacearum]
MQNGVNKKQDFSKELDKNGNQTTIIGLLCVLFAYIAWGMTPLYTQFLEKVSVLEVISHRILWSLPGVFFAVVYFSGGLSVLKSTLKNPKTLFMLMVSAALLASHWGVFVYALLSRQGLATSLSFFVTPIFSLSLGAIFLKERLNLLQIIAAINIVAAMVIMTIYNGIPMLSLAIAVTWSAYCFARKTIPVNSNEGFFIEMCILAVPTLFYVIWLIVSDKNHSFMHNTQETFFLMGYGLLNSIIFCVFAYGIKRTKLTTVGLMEYIAPLIMAANTVFILKQPINTVNIVVFSMVIFAMIIYVLPIIFNNKKG